jgi:quinol monooxygenase YgiN
MIHVIAFITCHPGQRDAVLAAMRENVPLVHAEDGCIEYQPVVDAPGLPFAAPAGPDTVVVVEKWRDAAALAAHAAAPHMKAYGAKTKALVAERRIHVFTPA